MKAFGPLLSKHAFVVACFGLLAICPAWAGAFGIDLVTKIMVYAILALSLELLVGQTGLVCFGQAAFFGVGAYATVLLTAATGAPSVLWLAPAACLAAALCAFAVGLFSLRTQGVYFIMVTLAFSQMAYYVVHDTPLGGGTDGIYLLAKPSLLGVNLDKPVALYLVTLAALVSVFALLALVTASRFGHALAGIRLNETRMRTSGYATYPYKLAAFTLSGGVAGLGGFLFAVKDGVVNPELLSWHQSGALLVIIIFGGLGHLRGALIGAFAFTFLQEFFQSEQIFGSWSKHWNLGFGMTIIASVALLPRGLVSTPEQWRVWRLRRTFAQALASDPEPSLGQAQPIKPAHPQAKVAGDAAP